MSNGLADLMHSERGTWAGLLLLCSLVLVMTGKITGTEWLAFAMSVTITLIVSKTVTTAVETAALKKPQIAREDSK